MRILCSVKGTITGGQTLCDATPTRYLEESDFKPDSGVVEAGPGGKGRGGVSFSDCRVSVLPDENIPEMGCTTL